MPAITRADHSAESIARIAGRLNTVVLRLQAAAHLLKEHQIDRIEVTHQSELMGGMSKVENWADALGRCVQRQLEERGCYQAPPPDPAAIPLDGPPNRNRQPRRPKRGE
jgi:hypothetical protein